VLYLAIPAFNEVATIGVLLWRLRTVLAEFPREYEVVVYDDASTDETATVAEQYERAMPVRVLRGTQHLGYAGATEALLRHIANATRYPRRDAVLLMQGDFTDPPVLVPEFARRFEGGADLVVGERTVVADAPIPVRRLFRAAHWAMRPFVRVDDVRDLTASMRLVRIAALRDALRVAGDAPFLSGDSWTANADLLLHLAPHARRVESVPLEPTYGVRMRETRRVAMRDGLAILKWAWGARRRKAFLGSETDTADGDRRSERGNSRRREERKVDRRDEPELSVERLREKVREREGTRGLDGAPPPETRRERQRSRDREREVESRSGERGQERSAERTSERGAERNAERGGGERSARREKGNEQASERTTERPARPERSESSTPRERAPRAERTRPRSEQVDGQAEGAPERTREPRQPRARGGEEQATESRRPRREASRDETPRAPLDGGLELDDPFAPPSPRRDRLEEVLDARPDRSRLRDETPGEPVEAPDQPSEAVSAQPNRSFERHDAAMDDDERDTDSGEDSAEDTDEGNQDGTDAEGQPRKRRRNRRSRRGRRRRSGADGGVEGEAENGADDLSGESRAEEGHDSDATPSAGTAMDSAMDDAADDASDEFDDETAARPRRRGRRGRRGGARRSRGRRDRGDGASGGEAPAADD
jgi:hypothetical protein